MGFSIGASQCLVAPPYGFAGILMWTTSWFGDKYRLRAPVLLLNALITITGLPLLVSLLQRIGLRLLKIF